MMNTDFNIEEFLSLHKYADGERGSRRKGSKGSQEFFTPYKLVKFICDKISDEKWNNPEADFLEPCFGNGQFLIYILYKKIISGSTWEQALKHTKGIELMEDNINETYKRILDLFDGMGLEYDRRKAMRIMKKNLVCADFFQWDFLRWRAKNGDK